MKHFFPFKDESDVAIVEIYDQPISMPGLVKKATVQPSPAKKQMLEAEQLQIEKEEEAEIEALEHQGKIAGTGGFGARKSFFKQQVQVLTGVNDKIEPEQIANVLSANLDSLKKKCFVVGGETKAHFPDVRIISGNNSANLTPEENDDVSKFFSIIIPTKMHPDSQDFKYFLRKGVQKVENETLIELTETELKQMQDTYAKSFAPYLKGLNGARFKSVLDIPKKPQSLILRDIDEKTKLIFKIDEYQGLAPGQTRLFPNISIRVWEYSKRGWAATKKGVTISSFNFHLFMSITLEAFLDNVKTVFGFLHEQLNEMCGTNEPTDLSGGRDSDVVEPFPF